MDRILWTTSGFLASIAVALALTWIGGLQTARVDDSTASIAARAWEYSWPESATYRDLPDHFDVGSVVRIPPGVAGAVRLLVHATPSDARHPSGTVSPFTGLYVDIDGSRLATGRIEAGMALPRGSAPLRPSPEGVYEVALKRRRKQLAVAIDGALALLAYDHCFSLGRAGVGVAGGARVELRPVVRLPELPEFADDFMRTADDPSPWTVHSGSWKIESLPTPSMSANGFSYRGKPDAGGDHAAAFAGAGNGSWDNYRVEVSARGEVGGSFGLAFAVQGAERYVLFRWAARTAEDEGRRELVLVDGRPGAEVSETVLASSTGGYAPEQWYRLAARVGLGRARVFVDGHELFAVESDRICSGAIGLWTSGKRGAVFDDVEVLPERLVHEQFGRRGGDGPEAGPSGWKTRWDAVGGSWRIENEALVVDAREMQNDAKLLSASGQWRRFAIETTLDLAGTTRAGVVACYADESNYVALWLDGPGPRLVLERMAGGQRQLIDEAPVGRTAGSGKATIRLVSDRGHLAGYVNREILVQGWDEHSLEGRVGLLTCRHGSAVFGSFTAERLPHAHPVSMKTPVFESESLMSAWADDTADWYRSRESGPGRDIYWHRASLYGDVELALDLPYLNSPEGRIVLGISKSGEKPQNGYGWKMEASQPGADAGAWRLTLQREGVAVRELALESGHQVSSVFLRRQGRNVTAGVNGEVLAQFPDHDPLEGARVAYLAEGIEADPSRARLYGGYVFDYLFNRAPADWRVAAGIWEITNRWQCDQRWSFFSGMVAPDGDEKAVVIWNKRSFPGDVVVDFFVAPRMEPARGRRYEYARDFNISISADGRDLTSGYSFVFGGFGNTRSGIYRGTRPLVETHDATARIPASMIIHQRWYHVHLEREGKALRYSVNFNGRTIASLDCEDPEPLEGDRIAIWSYDCNVSVARLRIATSSAHGATSSQERPDLAPPRRTVTIYDGAEEKPE